MPYRRGYLCYERGRPRGATNRSEMTVDKVDNIDALALGANFCNKTSLG